LKKAFKKMDFRNYLRSGFDFSEKESLLLLKFKMLNSVLLLASFFSFFISILAFTGLHSIGFTQAMIDFFYGALLTTSIFFLRISKKYFQFLSYTLLSITLVLFTFVLVNLTFNEGRIIWFFLLIALAFILTDCRGGMIFSAASIGVIILLNILTDLHFSQVAINTSVFSLLVGSVVFWFHAREITQYQKALKQKNSSLDVLASTDYLTGIMNKRIFAEVSKRYFNTAQRDGTSLTLFLLDLDYFKTINDTYGHDAGDKFLKYFVKTIENTLRASDIFARIGGEEFAILISKMHQNDTLAFAKKLRNTTHSMVMEYQRYHIRTTLSIGISQGNQADSSFDDILFRADMALYEAKNEGRNRTSYIHAKDTITQEMKIKKERDYLDFSI